MEKAFREWLQRCHAELDKSLRFEDLAEPEAQAAARKKAGVTLFRRSTLEPILPPYMGRIPMQMVGKPGSLPSFLAGPVCVYPLWSIVRQWAASRRLKRLDIIGWANLAGEAALQVGGGHGGGPDGGERRQHRQPRDEARPVRPHPALRHRQGAANMHRCNHKAAEGITSHAHAQGSHY